MDFSDTKEERAFREEAREWLGANIPTTAVSYTHLTLPTKA